MCRKAFSSFASPEPAGELTVFPRSPQIPQQDGREGKVEIRKRKKTLPQRQFTFSAWECNATKNFIMPATKLKTEIRGNNDYQ
jgi:hypothetical protein